MAEAVNHATLVEGIGSFESERVGGRDRRGRSPDLPGRSRHTQAAEALQVWLAGRRGAPTDPLFSSLRGGPSLPPGRQARLHCPVELPSLDNKTVTPHVLWHSGAMQLLAVGTDPLVIALRLGHENIESRTSTFTSISASRNEPWIAPHQGNPVPRGGTVCLLSSSGRRQGGTGGCRRCLGRLGPAAKLAPRTR